MKNKRLFILSMLLMIVGNILADNISVNDITLSAGEEKQITINLTNTENNYVAFQFDLVLPAGVTVAKDNKGRFVASITEERNIDHILTVGDVGSNTFRFLSYSGTNSEFWGKEGALLNVTLKADESLGYGEFTAKIVNPKFTLSSGTKITLSEASFLITNPRPDPDPITVKAKNSIRKYGDANPSFEYTVFPEGSSLSGEPDFICVATPTSPVGQYEIVVSRGSITNENVTFVNGTLDVQKTLLTIKADDKQMTQGDPLPEFTATYIGFTNNETEAVLTKKPEFTCTAVPNSPAGTYEIVPSNAEAQNYDITYINGTLSIVPGPTPDQKGYLSADDIEIKAGNEAKENLYLTTFDNKYVAFQFDLILPSGVTIAKDEKGLFVADLEDSRRVDHILNVGEVGTSTYRILSYSNTNTEFFGNDGAIMYIQLKADDSMEEGEYDATISNQKFTLADGTKHSFDNASFSITIKPRDIVTITAKNAIRKYGDANPSFEYTVFPEGSSLSGEPDFICVATPTSPVGQYEIVVSRGSITNENVTFVNGTLDVQKTLLTIKADDKQMTQGDPLPEFTATYTGFKNNETEAALIKKPEFNCAAASDSPIGTYDIILLNAEAQNYEISYSKGTLTIIPKIVTVRVKDCSRLYGDDNPTFEYTVEGGTLNAEPRISCNAYKSSDVGEYEIRITWGDYKDKDANFVNGTLTVNPTPLTVAVGNYTKKRGKPLPEFEITYSGFKNYDSTYSLEKEAIATCEATEESEPGEYEIKLSGAEAKNYEMLYQNGTLTLIPPISVEFSNMVAGQLDKNVANCGHSKMEIDELRISGQLNGTDVKYIREMIISGELTALDIKNARIVSGGDAYYNYEDILQYYTKNDIIGNSMFEDCVNLMTLILPSSARKIEMYAISRCDYLKTLDIPELCEEIESYGAISNCKRLEQINISSRLHTIGTQNFDSCPNLRKFNVVENNNWYCSKEGVLFSKDEKNLLIYPMGKVDISYVIPEGTLQIGESAFERAILQEVYIPKTICRVGEYAFAWCKKLTTIWSYIENLDGVAFDKDFFDKVNAFEYMASDCTWNVVKGTSADYINKDWWVESWVIIEEFQLPPYPTSGIAPIIYSPIIDIAWYTLQGVKLDAKPTKPGIYVHGGRKIVIR